MSGGFSDLKRMILAELNCDYLTDEE